MTVNKERGEVIIKDTEEEPEIEAELIAAVIANAPTISEAG